MSLGVWIYFWVVCSIPLIYQSVSVAGLNLSTCSLRNLHCSYSVIRDAVPSTAEPATLNPTRMGFRIGAAVFV